MKILFYTELTTAHFLTDFDLDHTSEAGQALLLELEKIEGVETVRAFRYHIDVTAGFLFSSLEVAASIKELLERYFSLDEIRLLTADDLISKVQSSDRKLSVDEDTAEKLQNLQLLLSSENSEA